MTQHVHKMTFVMQAHATQHVYNVEFAMQAHTTQHGAV